MGRTAKEDNVCMGVVANRNGDGVVLWAGGPEYFFQFLDDVSWQLCDVGLDDAPDGIHIWEGHINTMYHAFEGDYDSELVGKFREPTDAEWAMIRQNKSPWTIDD